MKTTALSFEFCGELIIFEIKILRLESYAITFITLVDEITIQKRIQSLP